MRDVVRKTIKVKGYVQGVGFRYRAYNAANLYRVTGWVQNNPDGSVSMEMQGSEEEIDKVFETICNGRYVEIDDMEVKRIDPVLDERGFEIRF